MSYPILKPDDFRDESLVNLLDFEIIDTKKEEQDVKEFAEKLSILVRATKGLPIDPQEQIRYLIDIKEDSERTRFPTYPVLERNLYLRLIHKMYGKVAKSCLDWAKAEASALISYKGQSRKEYVDSIKKATQEGQEINIGRIREEIQKKKRFWQREQKEKSEFENQ